MGEEPFAEKQPGIYCSESGYSQFLANYLCKTFCKCLHNHSFLFFFLSEMSLWHERFQCCVVVSVAFSEGRCQHAEEVEGSYKGS